MEQLPEKQTEQPKLSQTLTAFFDQNKTLNAFDKEIAVACSEPSIRNFAPNKFVNQMLILIGRTHLNCGFKFEEPQKEATNLTIDELCEDLKKYNGSLSFSEIELAFKNGYKKQYGDFFGLNNATYFQWVNAYAYAENRLRIKKLLLEAKEKQNTKPEKSEAEIKEIIEGGIITAFEQFKKGGLIFDAGNVKYNYLVKIGLLNFTIDRKKEIFERVKERMKQDAIETKANNETIAKALSKIMPENVVSQSRVESLKIYFMGLIDTGIEISDILENKI